ncbi:MAG: response regulator [Lachnospiraceae bacterium]|nr:response regulator [Lachnospiraceae bacterium]
MEDDIFLQLSNLLDGKSAKSGDKPRGYTPEYGGNPDSTMFTEDDMIVPDIKPRKSTGGRRSIVIIDDDFSTLDLMKIYLQRDYDVETFDNPKNAIFFLNGTVPDMIFIDCYLDIMPTRRVLEIIRTYKELAGTPIIYLAEPSEQAAIESKLPEDVSDIISRPVKRADLQRMLDTYIKEDDEEEEGVIDDTDGVIDDIPR